MNKRFAKMVAAGITSSLIRDYCNSPGHIDDVINGHWTEADHDRVMIALDQIEIEMRRRAFRRNQKQEAEDFGFTY